MAGPASPVSGGGRAGAGDRLWQGGQCQRTMSCVVPSPYPDMSTRRVPPASPLLPAHACCHHGAHSPSEAPPSLSELQALSGGGGGRRDWPAVGLQGEQSAETSQPRFFPAQDIDDLHHRALPSPPFTSTLPAPRQQPRVVGAFGVPHPGHPSSACPNSLHNIFLSLSHHLLPQAPLATGPASASPGTAEGSQTGPEGLPPSPRKFTPRPWGFPDDWGWGKVRGNRPWLPRPGL